MLHTETTDAPADPLLAAASDSSKTDALYEILGEYCHVIRNRLNCLKISLYLTKLDADTADLPAWTAVEGEYGRIEQFIEQLQTICRPMALAHLRLTVGEMLSDRRANWSAQLASRGLRVEWAAPGREPEGRFDAVRLADALDAFVAWRAEAGQPGGTIRIEWCADDNHLRLVWHEPEGRGLEAPATFPERPASLALPMLSRVVNAHNGHMRADDRNGLRLELIWPIDASASAG